MLQIVLFSTSKDLRTNDRRHGDNLLGFSKDSEVLEYLPVTDGLSFLRACLLDKIRSPPHPTPVPVPPIILLIHLKEAQILGRLIVSLVVTTFLYISVVATLPEHAPCLVTNC